MQQQQQASGHTAKTAKRRMQSPPDVEKGASDTPTRASNEAAYSMAGRSEGGGDAEMSPQPSLSSSSIDALANGMAHLSPQITTAIGEGEYGFEDTSEDLGVVYFRLVSEFRVTIALYNKEHEKRFRQRASSTGGSRRSSPPIASNGRFGGVALATSTPPPSPVVAQVHKGVSGLSMSMVDMRTHLFTDTMAFAASRPGSAAPSRSASIDNIDATNFASWRQGLSKTDASTVWDVAQKRNIDDTPKLSLGEVVGLAEVRQALDEMVIQYSSERVRRLFTTGGTPPERTLFVRSDQGSGIHTLVNAVCKKAGVNILRVTYGAESKWKDDFFVQLLDFAIAVQPVIVMFDRCDQWFLRNGEGWCHRGDKMMLALRGNNQIESRKADVMFVVSCATDISTMHETFIRWVRPYRRVRHVKMTEDEARDCLCQALCSHINEVERTATELHDKHYKEYGGIVDASAGTLARDRKRIQDECRLNRQHMKELAETHANFFALHCTPAMIWEFVSKAIDSARLREVRRETQGHGFASPSMDTTAISPVDDDQQHLGCDQALALLRLVPTDADLAHVIASAASFGPGTIDWKSAPASG